MANNLNICQPRHLENFRKFSPNLRADRHRPYVVLARPLGDPHHAARVVAKVELALARDGHDDPGARLHLDVARDDAGRDGDPLLAVAVGRSRPKINFN